MPDLTAVDIATIDAEVQRATGSDRFGITDAGFVPKGFTRLVAEKLALAASLLGDGVDLRSGSVIRKLIELTALEDARTWAAVADAFDNSFVVTATGAALTALGDELGIPRPHRNATGVVTLELKEAKPPDGEIAFPRGLRLLSDGGHHAALAGAVVLSAADPKRDVAVEAFYPGPEHNLDPQDPRQRLSHLNPDDEGAIDFVTTRVANDKLDIAITMKQPLTGGELQWADADYRRLLQRAPRSVWSSEALQLAASLVPGVRRAQVRDGWGGLDIDQSIFGNFNFIERLFASERDLASPYYVTILVAPTAAAIWPGPDGLRAAVESAVEDLRPVSIFPSVQQAEEVSVAVRCSLTVRGVPLPSGSRATVNASSAATALKARLLARLRAYIESLDFGEPVRASEVTWSLMNEPGIADVRDLRLVVFPPGVDGGSAIAFSTTGTKIEGGGNVELSADQIPSFVDDASGMEIA